MQSLIQAQVPAAAAAVVVVVAVVQSFPILTCPHYRSQGGLCKGSTNFSSALTRIRVFVDWAYR